MLQKEIIEISVLKCVYQKFQIFATSCYHRYKQNDVDGWGRIGGGEKQ